MQTSYVLFRPKSERNIYADFVINSSGCLLYFVLACVCALLCCSLSFAFPASEEKNKITSTTFLRIFVFISSWFRFRFQITLYGTVDAIFCLLVATLEMEQVWFQSAVFFFFLSFEMSIWFWTICDTCNSTLIGQWAAFFNESFSLLNTFYLLLLL